MEIKFINKENEKDYIVVDDVIYDFESKKWKYILNKNMFEMENRTTIQIENKIYLVEDDYSFTTEKEIEHMIYWKEEINNLLQQIKDLKDELSDILNDFEADLNLFLDTSKNKVDDFHQVRNKIFNFNKELNKIIENEGDE